ncbi:hypothetical protein [Corynebacterium variabile]|uniref:Uncharacterized protein n=1 Tax=Corynebacterium variabile TaxID=1727 RepID=A0A4Y4C5W6_9CORY|nr:hypothetical protein [Corynebacterium variabile]GEC87576.1 hypothetical protein CVA01_28900 [Corynebacterium variabile]
MSARVTVTASVRLNRWPGMPEPVTDFLTDALFSTDQTETAALPLTPGQWACIPGITDRLRLIADALDAAADTSTRTSEDTEADQ